VTGADEGVQVIGVDVGGTALKLARLDRRGRVQAELTVPTPQPAAPGAVTTAIVEAIERLDPDRLTTAVGVGMPGPTDRAARLARLAINLPGWVDVPLADWLEPRLGRAVTLANDADCALLGEHWLGAARGCRDVVLLTLGTGVGGGVLLEGKLFNGRLGAAAEPGLIGIDPDGPPCSSGNSGSLESFCSIAALRRQGGDDPAALAQRAAVGDPGAREVWERYGRRLGFGITTLVNLFTPERVLLGGGVSAAFDHFGPALQAEVDRRVLPPAREGLEIRPAALGNAAGRTGAASLALQRLLQLEPLAPARDDGEPF
jgi:glucokinase